MAEDDKKKPKAGKTDGKGKKKKAKGPSPLAGLLARILPKKGAKKTDKGGPDPFDDAALMAQIAGEVASIEVPDEIAGPEDAAAAAALESATAALAAETAKADAGPSFALPDPSLADDGDYPSGSGGGFGDEDDLFPIRDEVDEAAEAYRAKRRKQGIIASIAASVLVVVVGGGLWALFSGDSEEGPGTTTARGGIGVINEGPTEGGIPLQIATSGPTVSGAIPPLTTEAPAGALGDEKSGSRRPWLDGGNGVVPEDGTGDPAQTTPPEGQTAEDPAPTTEPARDAQEPAQMAVLPVLPRGTGPLPTLDEPAFPPLPVAGDTAPTFTGMTSYGQGNTALVAAPIATLVRETTAGMLPVRGPDGAAAWRAYGGSLQGPADQPRVSLIVSGLGMNLEATEAAIAKLPASVTLAFSPYAPDLNVLIAKARAQGHEVLLELPLESETYPAEDPGPLGLMTTLSPAENLNRLERLLGKATGYTGVLARGSGRFTKTNDLMRIVLKELAERGLLYVHPEGATGLPGTEGLDLPSGAAMLAVDARPFRGAIDARLGYLADVARARGVAIGVARPLPVTFDRLGLWARGLTGSGVVLAPASAVVNAG